MKYPQLTRLGVLVISSFLFACGAQQTPLEMKMDLQGGAYTSPTFNSFNDGNFFHNGFPTDFRLQSNGKIDISDFPRRFHPFTASYINVIEGTLQTVGYHTVMPVYLPFTGPLDVDSLPQEDAAFASPIAPIQVVDIDPQSPEYGRRFPLQISMTTGLDPYRPSNLLELLPTLGVTLRNNTTYAAYVLNNAPLESGYVWQQNAELQALLTDSPSVPEPERVVFEPLRSFLNAESVPFSAVMAATVWTTGDPTEAIRKGAEFVADLVPQQATGLHLDREFDDYCVVAGEVEVPGFQQGIAPYLLLTGDIQWDSQGNPIQAYSRAAPFVVTIPKNTAMPAQGFPMLFYHHGAGGSADQVVTRGQYQANITGNGPSQVAAERGWASSGFAGHLGTDHMGVILGFGQFPYNVFNPAAMLNNYYQMVWERIYFRRVLNQLTLDPALCPGALAGESGEIFFNSEQFVAMGQSLGNWTASLQMAVDPKPFQGAVLTGVAGTWIRVLGNREELKLAIAVGVINQVPIHPVDDTNPFMMLLEWALGSADPVAHMASVLKEPTKAAPHIFSVSGIDDNGGEEPVQRPFLMSLGVDLAGDDLGGSYDTTLFPHMAIAGAEQLGYPAGGNVAVPGQGDKTALVVRYENTVRPDHNGHHVAFDLEAPKHQYGCFLQHIAEGKIPIVSVGVNQGDGCLQ